jgi:carbamoyltransferase
MYILGINSVYHESCACLLKDGQILMAVEEERFNRVKHGKEARTDNPWEIPHNSINSCLNEAGISIKDIDHVAYSTSPIYIRKRIEELKQKKIMSHWTSWEEQEKMLTNLAKVPKEITKLGFEGEFHWVRHHLCHAASAYYASPFDNAAILIIDGIGDDSDTGAEFYGMNNKINEVVNYSFPDSIGFLWEYFSLFLGFSLYDAAKVMGLASYGDSTIYQKIFQNIIALNSNGEFSINNKLLKFEDIVYYPARANFSQIEKLFGFKQRQPDEPLLDKHKNLAAALQTATNQLVKHLAENLYKKTKSKNLCLAGGVALNCVTNTCVFENTPFENLYIQPGANDAGTAVGAAMHVWYSININAPKTSEMTSPYTGPSYDDIEIEEEIKKMQLTFQKMENVERTVAELISQGAVVGYFQGKMEFGPRALGSRSILADPRNPNMRDILNYKVKHREYFRPLAPSILNEHVEEWFKIKKKTTASDFMLMVYPAQMTTKAKIPATLHVDGTGRIQTVKKELSPKFHKVISEFMKITGVPVVLNTSFNDQEPIVCTPKDALTTFLKTDIDFLCIGSFILKRADQPLGD